MTSPSMPPPSMPAPGWYHDGAVMRWWDGHQWGPAAPPGALGVDDVESDKVMAVLAHVGFFIFSIFLALIFRQTTGKRNRFVGHHATEALNFQLTFTVVWLACWVPAFVVLIANSEPDGSVSGGWFVLLILISLAFYAVGIWWSILGAVRANQGTWWRYPVSIRFVRPPRAVG